MSAFVWNDVCVWHVGAQGHDLQIPLNLFTLSPIGFGGKRMEYVNRRGDRYYIFQGKTKTGKPKFFASKRETSEKGARVTILPDEFEVFENPSNGTVSVRRRKPSRIFPTERDLVDRLSVELSGYSYVQTIVDGDRIVIYTPDTDPDAAGTTLARVLGSEPPSAAGWTMRHATYSADMRFTIHDVDRRTYIAERYCYRGSVDRWIHIGGPAPLESLARKLVQHLGKDSFYDLF